MTITEANALLINPQVQDPKVQTSSIASRAVRSASLATPYKKYKDLDLSFSPHPITGNITPLLDVDAVKRSIRNLVLTNNYERFFRPDIGSNVTAILFAPQLTPFTPRQLESAVESVIQNYEPRANLIRVQADLNQDLNAFEVTIIFSVRTIPDRFEMTIFLKRTR